jgi:hypothetical protein
MKTERPERKVGYGPDDIKQVSGESIIGFRSLLKHVDLLIVGGCWTARSDGLDWCSGRRLGAYEHLLVDTEECGTDVIAGQEKN